MEFLQWFFDKHWVIAGIITPWWQGIWSVYTNQHGLLAYDIMVALCYIVWGLLWAALKGRLGIK